MSVADFCNLQLSAFYSRKSDSDSVDENFCRYQNSAAACIDFDATKAIASKCCRRNPNRSIDWHLAVLDSAKVRSTWAIASGRSSLKLDGFSQQEAEFGSEFDIG